jgi:hypothetical protein
VENSVDSLFITIGIAERGGRHVANDQKTESVVDLKRLLFLLTQDDEGFRTHIVPRLRLGDMWWIPDDLSGFGAGEKHPWVVVNGYSDHRASIVACPRTTQVKGNHYGIITPSGVLPGLTMEGQLLLRYRRAFSASQFREFEYIGQLSEEWVSMIEEFNRDLAIQR